MVLPCTGIRSDYTSYYTSTIMKIGLHTIFWDKFFSVINRYEFLNFVTNRKIYWNENQDIYALDKRIFIKIL